MRICFSCREFIEGGAIVSEGNLYHPEHFCCHRCRQPLCTGFYIYKVWRLCAACLPRPVCSSNNCSLPERRIGHDSGTFYRLPVDTRLQAFHSCHTVRCSVCGRGLFCPGGGPGDALVYHLSQGRPTCTRCYYHLDQYNRWQRMPGSARRGRPTAAAVSGGAKKGSKPAPRYRPPLPLEFTWTGAPPRKGKAKSGWKKWVKVKTKAKAADQGAQAAQQEEEGSEPDAPSEGQEADDDDEDNKGAQISADDRAMAVKAAVAVEWTPDVGDIAVSGTGSASVKAVRQTRDERSGKALRRVTDAEKKASQEKAKREAEAAKKAKAKSKKSSKPKKPKGGKKGKKGKSRK